MHGSKYHHAAGLNRRAAKRAALSVFPQNSPRFADFMLAYARTSPNRIYVQLNLELGINEIITDLWLLQNGYMLFTAKQ